MSVTEHGINLGDVREADAKAELERILHDGRLRVTDRHREILKYLCDLYFNGCDDGAKAYVIAIDVLGRASNFEPSLDPIVRIEMSRLRSALDAYYSAFGHETAIWLEVPRGRYVVHFVRAPSQHGDGDSSEMNPRVALAGAESRSAQLPFGPLGSAKGRMTLVAIGSIGLLAMSLPLAWQSADRSGALATPKTRIAVVSDSASATAHAFALKENLQAAILRFDTLRLGSEESSLSRDDDYQITINYEETNDASFARWSVIDKHHGRLLDAGIEDVPLIGKQHEIADDQLATMLAVRFAQRDGAIANAEIARASQGAIGNSCILRAYQVVRTRDESEIAPTVECLEHTITAEPRDVPPLN